MKYVFYSIGVIAAVALLVCLLGCIAAICTAAIPFAAIILLVNMFFNKGAIDLWSREITRDQVSSQPKQKHFETFE